MLEVLVLFKAPSRSARNLQLIRARSRQLAMCRNSRTSARSFLRWSVHRFVAAYSQRPINTQPSPRPRSNNISRPARSSKSVRDQHPQSRTKACLSLNLCAPHAESTLASPRFNALEALSTVYGIGATTARNLYALGLRTVEDLHKYYEVRLPSGDADDSAAAADEPGQALLRGAVIDPEEDGEEPWIKIALGLREDVGKKWVLLLYLHPRWSFDGLAESAFGADLMRGECLGYRDLKWRRSIV